LLESEVFERFEGSSERGTITIRVSVNSDSLATWFPEVLRKLTLDTRIRLEIIPDDQDFTEDRLKNGDALAIVTSNDKPVPGSSSVSLGQMEYSAVCTLPYFDNYFADGVNLATLERAPCISFDQKDSLPGQWILLSHSEIPPLDTHYVPSFEGHLLCCKQGIGWVMMPTLTVSPLIQQGILRELKSEKIVRVPLYWQMRNQSSRILRKLTAIVKEVAEDQLSLSQ
ncbi:MAG: ArgP/LysG family DNA-binding transcriptional regulator, partial [Gammaproteobacteria bacterium]|nr:ArgP/LysG family DNA-binding transcriptional regulator [Gammaproteobacteria bacterium]